MGADQQYNDIMQLIETLRQESADEIRKLREENAELKKQIEDKLPTEPKRFRRASQHFSEIAMSDAVYMAKSTRALEGLDDTDTDVEESDDGLDLNESVCLDPAKSSYATEYKYNLLKAKEVLITLHDVGEKNKDIDQGPGMWANYILNKERNSTLKVVNKTKLKREGKYYHLKSITKDLQVHDLIAYCKEKGIRAIVPTSVSDEIYLAKHKKELVSNDIYPFCCDDEQSYITLDHKWLSYQFCVENGIAQAETLALRVDTAEACRELAAKTFEDGKPCFVKECFDTLGGDGVIKADNMDEYEEAIERMTRGKGLQPASTKGVEQHIIVQAGHPGRIATCHSIFYKGNLVSLYVTKENQELTAHLGEHRLDMTLGTWSRTSEDLTLSYKLYLDYPADRNVRDQAVSTMAKVGKALNYTGMMEVEFIIEKKADAVLNVLEFNPRFSGACHAYVGSGMVQDYMHVLGLIVSTEDDSERIMIEKAGATRVRSDTHVPKSNFKDYNAVKFYLPQPKTILTLRQFDTKFTLCSIGRALS